MATKIDDSILSSVKQMLPNSGVPEGYTAFDNELIADINMTLTILSQIGVGKVNETFQISGTDETWGDWLDDDELLSLVPTYVAIRVRLLFDTPKSSIVSDMLTKNYQELEFRINDVCRRYHKRKGDVM